MFFSHNVSVKMTKVQSMLSSSAQSLLLHIRFSATNSWSQSEWYQPEHSLHQPCHSHRYFLIYHLQ